MPSGYTATTVEPAASNPANPVLHPDALREALHRYGGENVRYANGVIESTHAPRVGVHPFEVGGDTRCNRFLLSAPIDAYGMPSIYLSLLRQVCSNGMVGYSPTFHSTLTLGRGEDNAIYSIVRVLTLNWSRSTCIHADRAIGLKDTRRGVFKGVETRIWGQEID